MSATIDQRSKEQVNGSSKEAQFDYMQSQMNTYSTDPSAATVPGAYLNPYYTPYMPYQPTQTDMSAAAAWGTGDSVRFSYMSTYGGGQVAPTDYVPQGDYSVQQGGEYSLPQGVLDYGAQGIDYASMLDYNGYAAATPQGAYGWFPNGGDSTAWGNVGVNDMGVAATKDDLQGGTGGMDRGGGGGRGYPNSYYSVETMQMYGGGANGFGGGGRAQRDGSDINSVEQGMNKMNLNRQSGGSFEHNKAGGEGNINGEGASLAESISAKKATWANVASHPAEATSRGNGNVVLDIPRAPLPQGGGGKHGGGGAEYGTWGGEGRNEYNSHRAGGNGTSSSGGGGGNSSGAHNGWSAMRKRPSSNIVPGTITVMQRPSTAAAAAAANNARPGGLPAPPATSKPNPPAVVAAVDKPGAYNPHELDDASARTARFFIIKSYSEDDIHRSIKYAIWCSTEYGNKRLDAAWQEREGKGPVYLLYSVNGSGHFCGIAEMTTGVDYRAQAGIWAQSKWKGQFGVRWLYVKDVPNSQLRHIRLENNEGKPVTNSRDTQEVPPEKGRQVLRIVHQYRHTTSIFDDFSHYEKRQEEDCFKKDQNGGRD